jgi:hypothetical protein
VDVGIQRSGQFGAAVGDMTFDIAAAVNDRAVLDFCLMRSPEVTSGKAKLRIYEDYKSAGEAYNQALADATAPYLVLVHQDIYLPRGFLASLAEQLRTLNTLDPTWAVAGAIGMDAAGQVHGETWSSGLRRIIGNKVSQPAVVETLDEMLLVVRMAAGVKFDPKIPSFHMYGTDSIQTAKARGLKSYVIEAPVIHHSRPTVDMRGGFEKAYGYMQRKWRHVLPVPNLVCTIRRTMIPFWIQNARMLMQVKGDTYRREPEGDPVEIARELGIEKAA